MRSKEEAHDYRYFPDPDLLPLELSQAFVDELAGETCRNCRTRRRRASCGTTRLPTYDAAVLVAERAHRRLLRSGGDGPRRPRTAANWVINELVGRLNKEGKEIAASPVNEAQLGAILDLIADGTISGKIAKDVFEIVWTEGGDPRAIVEARGLKQVTDVSALEKLVDDIIAKNPDKVADAKTNPKAIGWFVGQVMKASGGKANPQAVNDLLKSASASERDVARRARARENARASSRSRNRTRKSPLRRRSDDARDVAERESGIGSLIRAFCAAMGPRRARGGVLCKIFLPR